MVIAGDALEWRRRALATSWRRRACTGVNRRKVHGMECVGRRRRRSAVLAVLAVGAAAFAVHQFGHESRSGSGCVAFGWRHLAEIATGVAGVEAPSFGRRRPAGLAGRAEQPLVRVAGHRIRCADVEGGHALGGVLRAWRQLDGARGGGGGCGGVDDCGGFVALPQTGAERAQLEVLRNGREQAAVAAGAGAMQAGPAATAEDGRVFQRGERRRRGGRRGHRVQAAVVAAVGGVQQHAGGMLRMQIIADGAAVLGEGVVVVLLVLNVGRLRLQNAV